MNTTSSLKSLKINTVKKKDNIWFRLKKDFRMNKFLYFMALPILLYYIVFNYLPMYGIVLAFESYKPNLGFLHSPWIGLKNFQDFFSSYYFLRLLKNTFLINVYDVIFGFPAPIIFALLLNEISNKHFKRVIQTVTYMPYFISLVVVCGLIIDFSHSNGLINDMVAFFGGTRTNLIGDPNLFRTMFVGSNIWQAIGYGSIIYLSAISAIDPELYQAATIDGAGRWRQIISITLPCISSTIIILLILRMGSMLNVGFEKIILLYSPVTYETGDVISSFVFRKGILQADYGFSAAVGLFNSVINFILLYTANKLSRKYTETSIW